MLELCASVALFCGGAAPDRPGVVDPPGSPGVAADGAADVVTREVAFGEGKVMSGGNRSGSNLSAIVGATLRHVVATTILMMRMVLRSLIMFMLDDIASE